jgi:alpha-glucoside transport system permease protein
MLVKFLNTILTVVYGVAGMLVLYWVLNKLAELLPGRWEERVKPLVFAGPAAAVVILYIVYPTLQTVVDSFANADSTKFVGWRNYTELLGSADFHQTLLNTLLWILVVPAASIAVGLGIAVLTDRMGPKGEKLAKTAIFLPMAVSAVGASTVWRLMYATNPPGENQLGLQNGIVTALGFDPVNWLQLDQLHFNSFELMVMLLWAQVGFAMVLLSAAVKGVPTEIVEAARMDGANEFQVFVRVIVPSIRTTIITVFITVTMTVLKVFDVVYVMTSGNFNTNIVGVQFFNELFVNFHNGHAAAIVVLLMIVIAPVMIYQGRQFRIEEGTR